MTTFNIVLFEPEIPANTGNIIRLCSNTGAALHLVRPLGFAMDDKRLRRAGLDYHEYASIQQYDNWDALRRTVGTAPLCTITTRGTRGLAEHPFRAGEWLVFGPETRGLPEPILQTIDAEQRLRIPMVPESRSLNLSNAVAVTVYEAWRQLGYQCEDQDL